MNSENYIKLGKLTAFATFLIGTLIVLGFYFTYDDSFMLIGILYIPIAFLINIIILILLSIRIKELNKLKKTIGLMLLNIPIAILYLWFGGFLLNTMRVTFVNSTGSTITDINITGCDEDYIDELKPNESETVWIYISGDCSISFDYINNSERVEDGMGYYITTGMGSKFDYYIGGKNVHF